MKQIMKKYKVTFFDGSCVREEHYYVAADIMQLLLKVCIEHAVGNITKIEFITTYL